MAGLNQKTLKELLRKHPEGEQLQLDFKRQLNLHSVKDKAELAKDVAEMCNTPGGGYLLYGFENDGTPAGIDPSSFNKDTIAQVIADRCQWASLGIDIQLVPYSYRRSRYTIGAICVPENRFEIPTCFKNKDGILKTPIRIGSITSYLAVPEAIEYYKKKRRELLPEFVKVDIDSMGVYDVDFSTRKSHLTLRRQPFEAVTSPASQIVPVVLPFAPPLYNLQSVLTCSCGSISEKDWLVRLTEVQDLINKHHGIIAQCWAIRNWELISPLPGEMEYVVGPSMECLKEALATGQIKTHSYLGWVVLAYRQALYVISGQLNNVLDIHLYLPYVPKNNEVVCLEHSSVSTKERDLWFTRIDGRTLVDWSGIAYWSADHPTQGELERLPTATIAAYMGSPDPSAPFPIRGLHILRMGDIDKIPEHEGKTPVDRGLPLFRDSLLPCYVSSKAGKENHLEARLTHLTASVQMFGGFLSDVYLFTCNAGLYQG